MSSRQMTEHPTPISDAVVRSRNVQEALQCIARGLDEVLERLQPLEQVLEQWASPMMMVAPVTDEWTAWSPPATDPGHSGVAPPSKQAWDQAADAIEAVRESLKTATGEDAQALQAQLNLLRDAAGEVVYDFRGDQQDMARNEGKRYNQDGDTVDLVPPSEERMLARYDWAIEHDLHTFLPLFGDDPAAAANAFAKGGAVWLHLDGREAIMQMPYEWRQWLVKDAAVDSEQQAQEMGADILKHRNSTDRLIAEEMADRG